MNKLIKACTRMALLISVSGLATVAAAQRPRGGAVRNPHGVPVVRPLQAHAQRANAGPEYFAFRNTVDQVPLHPTTPVFKLSHAYPKAAPPATCKECAWLNVNVDFTPAFPPKTDPDAWHNGHWDEYLKTVLDYVKEGQDPNLDNKVGFKDEVNGKVRWYNVPWMAYDPTVGREFVHGTTNERTAHLNELVNGPEEPTRGVNLLAGESQGCKEEWKHGFETWSVGYYNEYGGYAMGRAFPPTGRPHVTKWMGSAMPDGLPFPIGTVVNGRSTATRSTPKPRNISATAKSRFHAWCRLTWLWLIRARRLAGCMAPMLMTAHTREKTSGSTWCRWECSGGRTREPSLPCRRIRVWPCSKASSIPK
jgi:hypothetical protein